MDPLDRFSPATRGWFETSFAAPTPAQREGWEAISSGSHTLIHAPTGSGKTLAAFLWTIDQLITEPAPADADRLRVLYVSPMKALAYDIERNLAAPLVGIRHAATRLGLAEPPAVTTFIRTGDTPQEDRRRMLRNPPDILITTPESLYLLLTARSRETLGNIRSVIVDEVHAVAGTKRGAHLALSLERLEELSPGFQRIGLSATQRPLEVTASFLTGGRPAEIVDVASSAALDLEVVVPVADMAAPAPPDPLEPDEIRPQSIWPQVHPRILDLIERHDSTIVFANSRRLAERICAEINELAGTEIARSHHGSVSRSQRIAIEESLKKGELKAVVATSSLELGIDMGAVDLVIQVEAPMTVASGLQRVGRAGHQVGGTSVAKLFPKYRGDLVVSTVVADMMRSGRVEPTRIPSNPLDVLAQQLVATVVAEDRHVDDLFEMVRRARPFTELPRSLFDATLDMLAGRYPSDLFSDLRARLNWDRVTGMVTARPGALQLAVTNAGTIPDRGLYRVVLPDGSRVGELDEEMVYESREGDVFVLGSSTWKIADIGVDRVEVVPAPGESGAKLPFWHGDSLGRSLETGRELGRFLRTISELEPQEARKRLSEDYRLDPFAVDNLLAYLNEEAEAVGVLPDDRTITVQRFRDEIGDWRVVLLSPFGARVHAPWAMALGHRLRNHEGIDADLIWSDDGIAIRFPDGDAPPSFADLEIAAEEIESLLVDRVADSALFSARFREAAGRSLLLPRRRPGSRTPLWLQRRKAAGLLDVARNYGSFPIVLETYREILQDDFDVDGLRGLLSDLESRRIRLVEVETDSPSPFATSLLFAFVAAYMYEGDAPLAERKAAALTLDRNLLRELLGDADLTELLSPDVIAELELELQRLTPDRQARSRDAVADLLRDLGPLSVRDVELRSDDVDVPAVLEDLVRSRQAVTIRMGGDDAFAAIEDVARLRDAIGVPPPPGVPQVFLETPEDPLGDVVGRFARTHGPFTIETAASALHIGPKVISDTLSRLAGAGRVTQGHFTGRQPEWVDSDVLRRIKRRSLARLRGEIEPVTPDAYARFLPVWQGVDAPRRGRNAAADVLDVLQGAAIPASVLETDVLALRLDGAPQLLDQMMAEGEVMWVGREPLGSRDGRLALYRRSQFHLLDRPPASDPPDGPLHSAILEHLGARGASFFADIYQTAGGGDPADLVEALWDLVWAGQVTNDSLAPLRAFVKRRRKTTGRQPSFPPESAGRWSLVMRTTPTDTARAAAWAEQLLARHGIVTAATVRSEALPGGFSALYPVFSAMEEAGRLRRGYFVEGLGGAQFARSGAVDRLRHGDEPRVHVLAATDPANPYGATLPWPETDQRVGRIAGAYVVMVGGELGGFVQKGGRKVELWGPGEAVIAALADALAELGERRGQLTIDSVAGVPPAQHALGAELTRVGFVPTHRGMAWRRSRR